MTAASAGLPAEAVLPSTLDPLTLGGLLAGSAARFGDATAIVSGDRSISFRQLASSALRVASGLAAADVGKGTRVGLLMPNGIDWVITAFGVGLSGAVLVPLSTFATGAELSELLRHSDVEVLLLQSSFLHHQYLDELVERYPTIGQEHSGAIYCRELPYLRRAFALDLRTARGGVEPWSSLIEGGESFPEDVVLARAREVKTADDGIIIYTSGTSAEPKGVLHCHRSPVLQSWRWAEQMRLGTSDRAWGDMPLFWSAGFAKMLGSSLVAGARLYLEGGAFDQRHAANLLATERITVVHAPSHHVAAIADAVADLDLNVSSLRNVEPGALAKAAGLPEDHPHPNAAYGMTECFTIVTSLPSDAPIELRRSTHGRPLPGCDVAIVNSETSERCAVGEYGEIAVRGIVLMKGYYKKLPEESFDADGFYHTGDAGYLDGDGYLHWTGRSSNLIKTGGANVSPLEIEYDLAAMGLRHVAVIGVPHPTLGEAVVACAVPAGGKPIDEAALRADLRTRHAAYKVPLRFVTFTEEEVPLTASGKSKRDELRLRVIERLATDNRDPAWQQFLKSWAEA